MSDKKPLDLFDAYIAGCDMPAAAAFERRLTDAKLQPDQEETVRQQVFEEMIADRATKRAKKPGGINNDFVPTDTSDSNQGMKILGTQMGWDIGRSLLVLVHVEIPGAPLPKKTAQVVLDKITGQLRMKTFFRSQDLDTLTIEKLTMPADVVAKVEEAARQAAKRYMEKG